MLEFLRSLLSGLAVKDLIDIGLVAALIYSLLILIRGTRAAYMLTGLLIVLLAFWFSSIWELSTLNWLLTYFLSSVLLIIIVIFQNDIRRALVQVGRYPFFQAVETYEETQLLEEIIRTVQSLANKKIGALLVFEREANLEGHLEKGVRLDARISKDLITSIFLPVTPLHDGAVILKNGRITHAGCLLPLPITPITSLELGTRHRAAIGLSEETDAVVLVVSEERGSVSLAIRGQLNKDIDVATLRQVLLNLFRPQQTWGKQLRDRLSNFLKS